MSVVFNIRYIFALIWLIIINCHVSLTGTRVKTHNGEIEGSIVKSPNGKLAREFYGIPFAEPPLGDLRFKAPLPVKNWDHVLVAKTKPYPCIQGTIGNAENYPKFSQIFVPASQPVSEDCLYLNIWTPLTITKNVAVMIYVYGGGFKTGYSGLDLYNGRVLATEEDVVYVTFNYRLTLFGFLYLGDENVPGNMGLMDQALAFKWVYDNIKYFGGDPNRITIFGQSSGGASVSTHLILPSSQGLFARAIVESGSVFSNRFHDEMTSSKTKSEKLLKNLGCVVENSTEVAVCLQSKSVDELLKASFKSKLSFIPTVDGEYFPYEPTESIEKGLLRESVNIVIGHTSGDGAKTGTFASGTLNDTRNFFVSDEYFTKFVQETLGTNDTDKVQRVKGIYTKSLDGENYRRPLVDLLTDTQVLCGVNTLTDMAVKNGNNVYKYLYNHVSSISPFFNWEEVPHTSELYFIFGQPFHPEFQYSHSDVRFSKKMMRIWTNFAKYGVPTDNVVDKLVNLEWPLYNTQERKIYRLDSQSEIKSDRKSSEHCDFLMSVPTYDDTVG